MASNQFGITSNARILNLMHPPSAYEVRISSQRNGYFSGATAEICIVSIEFLHSAARWGNVLTRETLPKIQLS